MKIIFYLFFILTLFSCRFAVDKGQSGTALQAQSLVSLSMTNEGYVDYCYPVVISRSGTQNEISVELSSDSPGTFSASLDQCGSSINSVVIPSDADEVTVYFSPTSTGNYNLTIEPDHLEPINVTLNVSTAGMSGVVDTTFGTAGFTRISGISSRLIVKQSDDKILSLHKTATNDIGIVRLTKDGHLDNTFGVNGLVTIDVGGDDTPGDITIGPDDSIYVVGVEGNINGWSGVHFIIKLTKDGVLDTSFAGDGIYNGNNAWQSRIRRIAIQQDHKVVFGGDETNHGRAQRHLVLRRLNADGTLDNSYGAGAGYFEATWDTQASDTYSIEILDSGKLLAVGYTRNPSLQGLLTKVNENGTIDTSFGSSGYAPLGSGLILPYTARIFGNRIYVGGETGHNQVVGAYDLNGNLDTNFATGGYYSQYIGNNGWGEGIGQTADGMIYLSGRSAYPTGGDVNITKLDLNGNKDLAWGVAGVVTLDMDGGQDSPCASPIIQSDGRLVYAVASQESDLTTPQQVFFRIWP